MDSLKYKIIEKILNLLKLDGICDNNTILKLKEEIENNNLDNLINLVNNNFQDISFSKEIKQFVQSLVKSKLISENYLLKIYNINYIDFNKNDKFKKIDSNVIQLKDNHISQINYFKFLTSKQNNKTKEQYLREKIISARTNYLHNPSGFINNLELMNAEEIYKTFTDSHDITLIQHCISKLSHETLNRLLIFVENKINKNHYDVMSIFIEEAIKRNIHSSKIA